MQVDIFLGMYYLCYVSLEGDWIISWGRCPEGLVFIESIQSCDYAQNHPDDPCVFVSFENKHAHLI